MRGTEDSKRGRWKVLILVIMEFALWDNLKIKDYENILCVLILVIMEFALWEKIIQNLN